MTPTFPRALSAGMAAMRGTATAAKFAFILIAARKMTGDDFGRYGLLAATTAIFATVFGLEAYQIFMREIAQNPETSLRRVYGAFVLLAALLASAAAYVVFRLYGWDSTVVIAATALVALEYLGLETFRMLVAEGHPLAATLNISLRSGGWALALPLLGLMGALPATWPLSVVVFVWVVTDVIALLPFILIAKPYAPNMVTFRTFSHEMKRILPRLWSWVISTASLRVIDTGGRFVLAILASEYLSGRFTLVSQLGSLSSIGYKSIVEPAYFASIATDGSETANRSFEKATIAVVAAGSVGSITGALVYSGLAPQSLSTEELFCVAGMAVAFGFLTMAYIPHYALYRHHRDWSIALGNSVAAMVLIVASFALAWRFGLTGAVAGSVLGAAVLYGAKAIIVRRSSQPTSQTFDNVVPHG